jgi:hypothetical protein
MMAWAMGCMPPPPAPCMTRKRAAWAARAPRRKEAGDGKDGDAHDEEVARPMTLEAHPPSGQHDGVGDQVAGQHPGAFVGACAQRAGDVGQGHVGDGGVEHLHEGGQGHGHGDQPGIDAGLPARMGWCSTHIRMRARKRFGT